MSEEQPLVSVVIACVNGMPFIGECIDHLSDQEGNIPAEIIVADRCGESVRQEIRRRYPQVVLVEADAHATIPKLRAMGMAVARGEMIAILEDHCNVSRTWMEVVRRAHAAGEQAIGGAVENGATDRVVDWAVYFCEYARFMLPVAHGRVQEITGNNSVYDRRLLERIGPELKEEVWESFLHQKMREMGVPFYSDPGLLVSHKKEFGYGYFWSQRYHYSRSFAGMRMAGAPIWKRVAVAGASGLLLPPLLLWRMFKTVRAKGRLGGQFVRSLPVIGTFLVPWAWGEVIGSLMGPGRSLEKVE
jgi:glycosyltransferase involved in cell wall biosynthesis